MKFAFAVPLLASMANAFVPASPLQCPSRHPTHLHMFDTVEAAIADAQRICAADPSSPECKVAWDIVEELEAADSHKGGFTSTDYNASTDVEAFMGSFDILLAKIDGKMDQLTATTEKMAELGSRDPSIGELHERAYEMKQAIANARSA